MLYCCRAALPHMRSQGSGSIVNLSAIAGVYGNAGVSYSAAKAAGIYSDILTHVSTSVLQFINGDLDVDDDTVWNSYVAEIEGMNLDGLTEIIQTAYDRAHS